MSSFQPFRDMPGGGGGNIFPFHVTTQITGGSTVQAKVYKDSYLLKSLTPNDTQTISNLDTWFTVQNNDLIWLEITFNQNQNITACTIKNGQNSIFDPTAAAWDATGKSYLVLDSTDPNNVFQKTARVLLAQIAIQGSAATITQNCFTNLILKNLCVDFRAGIFVSPTPYSPYIPPA